MITLMERLGVNVVSVVIGALFFLIAIAWVEVLRTVTEYVFFHTEGITDYHTLQKKLLAAVFITAISALLIIIIYSVYKENPVYNKLEEKNHENIEMEDFPGTFLVDTTSATSSRVDLSTTGHEDPDSQK